MWHESLHFWFGLGRYPSIYLASVGTRERGLLFAPDPGLAGASRPTTLINERNISWVNNDTPQRAFCAPRETEIGLC